MKILIATDGTATGSGAVEMLGRFKLSADDSVEIVTVIDMDVPSVIDPLSDHLLNAGELKSPARANAQKILDDAWSKISEIADGEKGMISTEILFGSPASRIVEEIRKKRPDLVIIGSHGHSRLQKLFLGSVSDSVVRHAQCSVLVVRPQPAGENAG